ncbi:unnamed protein product [Schistosoma turkestanicum]|nr:unnamed protein product [Schistosoma turkestanicum]
MPFVHNDLDLPRPTLNIEIEVLILKLSTSRIMEQGQKIRNKDETPQVMNPPQMMYYGGYPVNQDQLHSSYFGYNHNPFNNSSHYSPNQNTEQMSINTLPTSNSYSQLGIKSEESIDFPVNSPSVIGNAITNNKNIVNSSPSSHCKSELLADNVDNALKGIDGSLKTDNTILPKIEKVSRSAQQPKLPQQTLTSSRSMQKVHSKSKSKKNNQVSNETDKDLQQSNPFVQWYQMMSQYYSQFYPGYQMPQPSILPQQQSAIQLPMDKSSRTPASHSLNPNIKHKPQAFQMPSVNQTAPFDYANYYFQYYAAAAQLWSGGQPYPLFGSGIPETPRFYNTPHIKAWMGCPGVIVQVLPSRPRDGEFARVEIINLFELVNEALADATRRASEISYNNTVRTRNSEFIQQHESSEQNTLYDITDSGMQTPSHSHSPSSITAGGVDEEDGDEKRACVMAAACWNRSEHQSYPGPLNRIGTLKADVLTFLHEKLMEIQDRLPVDWESADLLLMFLETLVKNNGVS